MCRFRSFSFGRCSSTLLILSALLVALLLYDSTVSASSAARKHGKHAHSARKSARAHVDVPPPSVSADAFPNLVFSDEFDSFDLTRWQHEITANGGGNWEFEFYTNNRSNSWVSSGVLHLRPTLTSDFLGNAALLQSAELDLWGGSPADQCTSNAFYGCKRIGGAGGNVLSPIKSARVRTVNSFNFKYGRLEVRAKLPRGDWIWPAIWLMPRDNAYGRWPASGEIDLVESRGNVWPAGAGGIDSISSTLHAGPFMSFDVWRDYYARKTLASGDFSTDFHVFGLVWTNDTIYSYVDVDDMAHRVLSVSLTQPFNDKYHWDRVGVDNPYVNRAANAPFDQPFYVIFNVAVGGTSGYFPDGKYNKPWRDHDLHSVNGFWNAFAQWYPTWTNDTMEIDWIHVYQSKPAAADEEKKHVAASTPGHVSTVEKKSEVLSSPHDLPVSSWKTTTVLELNAFSSWSMHAICATYAVGAVIIMAVVQWRMNTCHAERAKSSWPCVMHTTAGYQPLAAGTVSAQ